jgi:hypothetical protein
VSVPWPWAALRSQPPGSGGAVPARGDMHVGNTHTHRGGRRSNARRPSGVEGGPRGPRPNGPAPAGPPPPGHPARPAPTAHLGHFAQVPQDRPSDSRPSSRHHPPAAPSARSAPPRDGARPRSGGPRRPSSANIEGHQHGPDPAQPPFTVFESSAPHVEEDESAGSSPGQSWNGHASPYDLPSAEPGSHPRPVRHAQVDGAHTNHQHPPYGHQPFPSALHEGTGVSRASSPAAEGWAPRYDRAEHLARQDREPLRLESRGDIGPLIDDLKAVFERDRTIASQGASARCGICYLHFNLSDLEYREAEGHYVCSACARALGTSHVAMVRRQQR